MFHRGLGRREAAHILAASAAATRGVATAKRISAHGYLSAALAAAPPEAATLVLRVVVTDNFESAKLLAGVVVTQGH
jgi:hypothetical protein